MLPDQKAAEPNHNENGDKNSFAPLQGDTSNVADASSAAQNTFLEFLQRGKFTANMQKQPGPPQALHSMMPHMMLENNNLQHEFQQQQQHQQHQQQEHQQQQQLPTPHAPACLDQPMMGSQGPLSVEELEARLRQTGPATSNSPAVPNDAMKSSQQDMIAFKKLVSICVHAQSNYSMDQSMPLNIHLLVPVGANYL